jgi:hypothetical protein
MKHRLTDDQRGKGGAREGAGRPKDKFKEWAKKIVQSKKVQNYLKALAEGEPIEEKIIDYPNGNGKVEPTKVLVSASAKDRLKAIEILLDRGLGKVPQGLENSDGTPLQVSVINYSGSISK